MLKQTISILKHYTPNTLTLHTLSPFCFYIAHKNPYKHITMSHLPHNMFIDQYDYGEYPILPDLGSVASKQYEPLIIKGFLHEINQRYGLSMNSQTLLELKNKPFQRFFKKNLKTQQNFNDVLPSLLNYLSKTIIVRESRWTCIKEQKQRLEYSSTVFAFQHPENFQQFCQIYNKITEQLVSISNLGHSGDIPQGASPLERHFNYQMNNQTIPGVPELNKLQGQNDTFINRFMGYIHQI